jgi:hypothetical protein
VALWAAVVRTPWLVGLALAFVVLAVRALWRRDAPGAREVGVFGVHAAVATIVLWVFTEA